MRMEDSSTFKAPVLIFHGEMGGNGRDDADGNWYDKGGGHVEKRLTGTIDAAQCFRSILGETRCIFKLAQHDFGIDQIDDLKASRANGDGHCNGQQALHGLSHGLGRRVAMRTQLCAGLPVLYRQIGGRKDGAGCDAQNGARRPPH